MARYRMAEFWSKVSKMPEDEINKMYHQMHEKYADEFLKTILDLKGFYVKIGQNMATRADILPPIWIEKLRTLEDQVPPKPFVEVRGIVERSYGKKLEEVFSEFDEEPLGAASIGQVHRARLRSSGQQVAVKVQYPETEFLFRGDIANIRSFCHIAQPEQELILDEIERQFMGEFDYRIEACNLEQVRRNMLRRFGRRVVVPAPCMQETTKEVLVMEYLDGVKLISAIKGMLEKHAQRLGKSPAELEAEMKEKILREGGLSERRSGPADWQLDLYEFAITTRHALLSALTSLRNVVARIWGGATWPQPEMEIFINYPRVAQTLMEVHAHQILLDGFFNGDPHPGNILVLRDGRLGLIDYGQVKQLGPEERLHIAQCMLALADDDSERVVECVLATGVRSKHNDPYVLGKLATIALDRDSREVTEGMNFQSFAEMLHQHDPIVTNVDCFVMAVRVSILLRAVGYAFGQSISFARLARPVAEEAHLLLAGRRWEPRPVSERKPLPPPAAFRLPAA